MEIVSLFDGIACGREALERASIPVDAYHAFEIDPYAIQVSRKNWPDIIHMGDVTTADFTQYRGFDLLMGGSPCQSLSIVQSKTRQNLDGKSKLFFEYVRAKEEMNPQWFLFENVASMNAESKAIISELLGCEPVFIDSADFSAQSRPRLYWTNIPLGPRPAPAVQVLEDILQPADEVPDRYWYNCEFTPSPSSGPVCGVLGINGHDIIKRVNSPAHKCQTLTTCGGGNTQKKVLQNGRPRKLTPLEYERLQTLPDNYTAGISDTRRYTAIGNGWTVDVIAWILSQIPREEEEVEAWML